MKPILLPAKLRYRIIDPADYRLKVDQTNWMEHGEKQFTFSFHAVAPGLTNAWSGNPRGTVILLHGWGVAMFAMTPWALQLAEQGWRCVLVDLRGHGKSTGDRIYFGLQESRDLTQLLNELGKDNQLARPVAIVGESYGASLALRWKTLDPRIGPVVAIAPYDSLSNAVINISRDYAPWAPPAFLRSGLKHLPALLETEPSELDTETFLKRTPVSALFVAGQEDAVVPVSDIEKLRGMAGPGSKLIVVPNATHEAVTYFFDDLCGPVSEWLNKSTSQQANSR